MNHDATERERERILADRSVIVTGAGAGLGRAYALLASRLGASVVVNDINMSAAEAVVGEITSAGGRAVADGTSVSDHNLAPQVVDVALHVFGKLDAVINNAGTTHGTSFVDTPYQLLRDQLAIHLEGAYLISQRAFPHMAANGYGRFVFTSSASGVFGRQMGVAYASAKCAVIGLMNVVALEGAEVGVLANAVLPVAQTDIAARAPVSPDGGGAGWVGDLSNNPRYTPVFVAPLVAYLASPLCQSTHGIYSAVGGRYAQVHFALSSGWRSGDGSVPPSPTELGRHWDEISSHEDYRYPMSVADEVNFELARHSSESV
ncbi:MAG: SDR family NAD(P)-dependent oxidoreductase [Acidimicrobiales bacterium]